MVTLRFLHPKLVSAVAVWAFLMGALSGKAVFAMPSDSLSVAPAFLDREAQINKILSVLSRPEAQVHLRTMGVSIPEMKVRLEKMNDAQLAMVAQKADTVKAAGQLGLLIAALVIAILIVIFILLLKKV